MFLTDLNNNPTAFTTDVAKEAGLILGVDYTQGTSFAFGSGTLYTAKLLGDPVEITLRAILHAGFYTKTGQSRWSYIAIPYQVWVNILDDTQKKAIIGGMYRREGGVAMQYLFADGVIEF